MEDWQNSSLEEKVDLDNLVLFSPDPYPIAEISELRSDIKEQQSEEDNAVIENCAHNGIKTENVEFVEQESETRFFEFSRNGAEVCQTCGLEFGNKAVLKIHNSLLHPGETRIVHEGSKAFKCNICKYEAGRKEHLKKHMESVHEGIKAFKCTICDFKAGQKSDLKRHIQSVHEGIRPFKCNMCEYETATNQRLKRHTNSVHKGIK